MGDEHIMQDLDKEREKMCIRDRYIGSHTAIELLKKGYEIVIIDNFSNSNPKVLDLSLIHIFNYIHKDLR